MGRMTEIVSFLIRFLPCGINQHLLHFEVASMLLQCHFNLASNDFKNRAGFHACPVPPAAHFLGSYRKVISIVLICAI